MDGRKSIFELENKLEDPTFEMNRLFGAFFSEERRITHGRLLYNFQKELRERIFSHLGRIGILLLVWMSMSTFSVLTEVLMKLFS